jgi:2-polyprenyl-6-methoxyphenol hydroxylase-like FAD-dependent oxidoreductase
MKILIAGAGIAGLSMALALRARNIDCDIVEREAAVTARGAGMYLPGNAVRALGQLGVLDRVRATGSAIDRQRIFEGSGRLLNEVDLKAFWQACGGCLSLSRAGLQDILRDALGDIRIRSGLSVAGIQQDGPRADVTFSDGSTGLYDLVIGADGIQSTVRNLAFGAETPRDLGIACWRTIIDNDLGLTGWTAMLGQKRTLLAIPVEAGKLYVYGDVAAAEGAHEGVAPVQVLRGLFSSFAAPLRPVVESLDAAHPIHAARLREIPAQIRHKGSVVLIGDAAHATSPSMAQGAGMALEDALVLAEALAGAGSAPAALEAFSQRRLGRVQWVQQQSRKRDKVRTLPGFLRNLALSRLGTPLYAKAFTPLIEAI